MLARRSQARIGLLAAFCVIGCRSVVELELPVREEMEVILVGLEHDGELRFFAYEVDDFDPNEVPALLPYDGAATIYVLYYEESLEVLRLEPGEIPRARAEDTSRPLPDFDTGYINRVDGSDAGTWADLDAERDTIAFEMRAPPIDQSHCFEPTFDVTENPYDERFTAVVAMAEDEVIGISWEGDVVRVTPDRVEAVQPVERIAARAAARGPGDDLYLGGDDGKVYLGHPERGYTLVEDLGVPVQAMSSGPIGSSGDVELFVMTTDGDVRRYLDGAWLLSPVGETNHHGLYGELHWVRPGAAIAVAMHGDWFALLTDGRIKEGARSYKVAIDFVAGTKLADGRVALIDDIGSVFDVTDGGQRLAGSYAAPKDVFRIGALDAGFVYFREGGLIVYGELDRAECPPRPIGQDLTAWWFAPLAGGTVAFTTDSGSSITAPTEAHVVRIQSPSP